MHWPVEPHSWYTKRMRGQLLPKGEQTRDRILDAAEQLVLTKGFAATATEEVIEASGVTKSGFLYHFRDRTELAKALLERYIADDDALLTSLFARVDALIDDPLHRMLGFLKLFAEVMADLPEHHPGCIVASYCYQDQLFSQEIRDISRSAMITWRVRFRARLDEIARLYPPRIDVDLDALADMAITLVEGGIILERATEEPKALSRQMLTVRDFLQLVFAPS